ncbi:hypothetical protein ABPG72_018087 [Tetrahymena utriculariae]
MSVLQLQVLSYIKIFSAVRNLAPYTPDSCSILISKVDQIFLFDGLETSSVHVACKQILIFVRKSFRSESLKENMKEIHDKYTFGSGFKVSVFQNKEIGSCFLVMCDNQSINKSESCCEGLSDNWFHF